MQFVWIGGLFLGLIGGMLAAEVRSPAGVYFVWGTLVIVGCWLIARRMACTFDGEGITLTGVLRTKRLGWDQIRELGDATVGGGEGGRMWALRIDLRDPRRDWLGVTHYMVVARSTAGNRRSTPSGKPGIVDVLLPELERMAASHSVPTHLTGSPIRW